jgi:aspartate aminotransferase
MGSTIEQPRELRVSEMAENLVGSEIIKLAGEIKAKIAGGEKIYNFTIGDFNPEIFPIPTELMDEIIRAYQNGHTNYPAANGLPELRKAVANFLKTQGGFDYHPDQVLISGGARPLIYATYQALVDPGDTVLFPVPSWNNNHYTHLSHAKPIFIETTAENNFMPSVDELKPHIQDAALVAVCSPLNPTGTVFTKEGLADICDMILEENERRAPEDKPVYLMFDQIYWILTHGDTEHFHPVELRPEMRKYTVYVDGLSKAFAATGVRVGWAFGPDKIINKMKSLLSHVGAWSPKAEQVATGNYLSHEGAVNNYLTDFKHRINELLVGFYNGFTALKADGFQVDAISPQAAIYLTVQFDLKGKVTSTGKVLETTGDVTQYLLNDAKLAIVPFYCFGASKDSTWFRLSVGTARIETLDSLFAQLRASLERLS